MINSRQGSLRVLPHDGNISLQFLGDADVENAKLYGKVYGTFDGLTPNLMVIEPKIVKQILLNYKDNFTNRKVSKASWSAIELISGV